MRRKKRYLRLEKYPASVPKDAEFLFQDEMGYVFRTSIQSSESLRKDATLISGSLKKLKIKPKGLNRRTAKRISG